MSAATRRVEIIRVLSNSDVRIQGKNLGERFHVSKRTIEKDIIKLEDLGYRFDKVNGPNGGYKIIKPVPDLDFLLCKSENRNYEELVRMQNSAENQTEEAQRLLSYFKGFMIEKVFS